jgi:putative ABC transport system substrate-binding protein
MKVVKIIGFALYATLIAFCGSSEAQQQRKIARIGFLGATARGTNSPQSNFITFRDGLQELGYIEGKNLIIEYRNAEGNVELIPKLVNELLDLNLDIFVSTNPVAIRTAKEASKTIPIVMIITQDPIASGLVDSLARPGGVVTGLSLLSRELSGKRLELFHEILPKMVSVGIIYATDSRSADSDFKKYEAAGKALTIDVHSIQVRGPTPDLLGAINAASKRKVSGLISVRTSLLNSHAKRIADLGIKNRLPMMFEAAEHVDQGGLVSYANNDADSFKRAAVFVDKILKGAKPTDIPVEQPTKFELVINLKTAKQIGLTIPPNVLARADRVIR